MAQIVINNKSFVGKSITIKNGRVIVDGNSVDADEKIITIQITGDVENIMVDACDKISVNGNVGYVETTSGDIDCHDVNGNIKTTSGDVKCGDVQQSVQTVSGDVIANTITGSVKTVSGDIHH